MHPDDYTENCAQYVALVRSLFLGALVTPSKQLINGPLSPAYASPLTRSWRWLRHGKKDLQPDFNTDLQAALLIPLLAYFCVRTDFELLRRCLPQAVRDEVWATLLDSTLEEMECSEQQAEVIRVMVISYMGLMAGIIESNGSENVENISESIFFIMKKISNTESAGHDFDKNIFKTKFTVLLREYQSCLELLDPDG
jgi:hypothetical protein